MAISIKQLKEAASKIPDDTYHSGFYVHITVPVDETLFDYWSREDMDKYFHDPDAALRMMKHMPTPMRTVEFRSRKLNIDGVNVTGWYHGDVLVKVCV